MFIQSQSETRLPVVFQTKLEVIPGGITVAAADLTQDTLYAGTPVGKDANGLYHVIKAAVVFANAASTDTAYKVKKSQNYKVGDFISANTGANAQAITSIDASNADYDVLNVATTLGVAINAGAVIIQAKQLATANDSVLKYEPIGYVGTTFNIVYGDSNLVDCVVRGTIIAGALNKAVHASIQAKTPLVRFM